MEIFGAKTVVKRKRTLDSQSPLSLRTDGQCSHVVLNGRGGGIVGLHSMSATLTSFGPYASLPSQIYPPDKFVEPVKLTFDGKESMTPKKLKKPAITS